MKIIYILSLILFLIIYNRRCEQCNAVVFRLYKLALREDEDDSGHIEYWCKNCLNHLDYEYEEN